MSLYHLGIGGSPLSSPLRRQFASRPPDPPAHDQGRNADSDSDGIDDEPRQPTPGLEVAKKDRDALVQRLNHVIKRLSHGDSVDHDELTTLAAKVGELEQVLASRDASPQPRSRAPVGGDKSHTRHDSFWGPPLSPQWLRASQSPSRLEDSHVLIPTESRRDLPREPQLTIQVQVSPEDDDSSIPELEPEPEPEPEPVSTVSAEAADKIVAEAELLCQELSAVVKNLQDRREESDHIHKLLVEREERSLERILDLEDAVQGLNQEIQESTAELSHLRIQLKSIEVQCLDYIPADGDPELAQSIRNWKADYNTLRQEWAKRRGDSYSNISVSSLDSPVRRGSLS